MNRYLIPANSKKSQLIFSLFTGFDLILFSTGIITTLFLLFFVKTTNVFVMILLVMPALVTGALVLPIPNYHNVMGFLKSLFNYLQSNRKYYWRGWCVKDVYGRDNENRKN